MNVYIDIETLPDMSPGAKDAIEVNAPAQYKKPESIAKLIEDNGESVRDEQWRKTALNADNGGRILSIAYSVNGAPVQVCYGGDHDKQTLTEFFDLLKDELNGRAPFFVGHNVPFDLQFIWKRSIINGVHMPFSIKPHGRHGSDFYDTMQGWNGFKGRISQDNLSKLLGLEQKPDGISGANVLDHYLADDHEKIIEYNKSDVETVIAIYKRITQN